MRNRFDEQLFELNREIIEMGAMCEEAISAASGALLAGNVELAGKVKANGPAIDQMERDIESRCVKLLLHQQPVARDLRQISAALKMITAGRSKGFTWKYSKFIYSPPWVRIPPHLDSF